MLKAPHVGSTQNQIIRESMQESITVRRERTDWDAMQAIDSPRRFVFESPSSWLRSFVPLLIPRRLREGCALR